MTPTNEQEHRVPDADAAWDGAIYEALRAVDAHLARAGAPCDRLLTELRFELSLLLRRPPPSTAVS